MTRLHQRGLGATLHLLKKMLIVRKPNMEMMMQGELGVLLQAQARGRKRAKERLRREARGVQGDEVQKTEKNMIIIWIQVGRIRRQEPSGRSLV